MILTSVSMVFSASFCCDSHFPVSICACLLYTSGKFVAIKMHFGELGNLAFLRPNYAKVVADLCKEQGGMPFLTCLLYTSTSAVRSSLAKASSPTLSLIHI